MTIKFVIPTVVSDLIFVFLVFPYRAIFLVEFRIPIFRGTAYKAYENTTSFILDLWLGQEGGERKYPSLKS